MTNFRKLEMDELGRISGAERKQAPKVPLIFVLDSIRSLSNVGSIFRTADALGLEALYLCGFTGQPPHREIEKTALGATESVAWQYVADIRDCLENLKNSGYQLAALEQTTGSIPLQTFRFEAPLAVILGNEIQGVSEEALSMSDLVLEIPQFGSKHSLNVAVSAGMLAWEMLSQKLLSESN